MAPFSSCPLDSFSLLQLPHAPPSINKLSTIFEPPSTTSAATAAANIPQFPHPENPNSNSSSTAAFTADSSSVVTDKYGGGKKRKCRRVQGNSANTEQSKENEKRKAQKKMKEKKRDGEEEEEPKGYIHVRARRGQATDSHSLAERVRRERISERMKLLQALVPGCDKVTGKALMLDEIINYVQSLQNQVEFLSMKLASVNPMLYDFGMDLEAIMVRPDHQDISSNNMAALDLECSNILTPPNNNYNILLESIFPQPQNPSHLLVQGSTQSLWEMEENNNSLLS